MSEKTGHMPKAHKIWRNPGSHGQPVTYLGECYPPMGRPIFVAQDLKDMGFGPGEYTILAPRSARFSRLLPKWQKLSVSDV